MEKKLLIVFALAQLCLTATPVLVGPAPACTSFATGGSGGNDILIAGTTWMASGFACEQGDKIYSNFSPGALAGTDTTLRLDVQTIGTTTFFTATFGGNFTSNFTASYDIAVDLAIAANNRINTVAGDLSNPSNSGSPSNVKTIFNEAGATLGTVTSAPGNPGGTLTLTPGQTAVHVSDAYTANGGAAVAVSNTFGQSLLSTVPEPATLGFVGGVLMLVGLNRRRPRK
jgi:hypothetical protein